MPIQTRDDISPRESVLHEWETEIFEKQSAHAIKIKELDIEVSKIESRITAWFKLPLQVLRLPVSLFLVVVLIVYAIRAKEPPQSILDRLK